MLKKFWLLFFAMVASMPAMAQETEGNIFWRSGKIYVVVGVITIVFIGIVIYLISLDRKVAKLEKEIRDKQ
jgi:CcmD family protein